MGINDFIGTREELTASLAGARHQEVRDAVLELIEGLAPIRLDLLRTAIARQFGYTRTSSRILPHINALIPNDQLCEEADGMIFCWPDRTNPEQWPNIPRRGSVGSVQEVSLVELANLLDRLPKKLKQSADPTELYRRALHRLGLTCLTNSTRARLDSARTFLNSRPAADLPPTRYETVIIDENAPEIMYQRWKVTSKDSLAAIIPERKRRGIYVLEFENGDRYVGLATDVVSRFTAHVHGSAHHPGWGDITALNFRHLSEGDLRVAEQAEIDRQVNQEIPLRNRVGVLNSASASPMDAIVTIDEQEHWSLGDPDVGRSDFASFNLGADSGVSKLKKTETAEVYSVVLDDLAFAVEHLIPAALETERHYWTLSDSPSTAGGRYATLNTGVLEFLVFPKQLDAESMGLGNGEPFASGTLLGFFNTEAYPDEVDNLEPRVFYWLKDNESVPFAFELGRYALMNTLRIFYPVGRLRELAEADPSMALDVREFALLLMRYRRSGLFQRWHSRALTDEVYRHIQRRL